VGIGLGLDVDDRRLIDDLDCQDDARDRVGMARPDDPDVGRANTCCQ
jgi:hypothetical protein